jgi:Rieske Fe-S protein
MDRRNFLKVIAAGSTMMAVSPSMIKGKLYASDGNLYKAYEKVQLVDGTGNPIKAADIKPEVNYIFNYPHVATPCLLLNLPGKTETDVKLQSEFGEAYVWKSGVGANRSIVAYSAICSHQMTHPTPNDSFIQYVPTANKTMAYSKSGIIVCSSHLSAYDAKAGAKVLAGAAGQPLASIVLEHKEDDTLWAVGVLGADKFHDYFKSFKPELKEFYNGSREAKKLVKFSAKTIQLTEFSKELIQY